MTRTTEIGSEKTYLPPRLAIYGGMVDMTAQGSGPVKENTGMDPQPNKQKA